MIAFHLGYIESGDYEIEVNLKRSTYDPVVIKIVAGDLDNATDEQKVIYDGIAVATQTSILGNLLNAYNNLAPSVISDSLGVSEVGSIKLRGNELRKRRELYEFWRGQLGLALNTNPFDDLGRIGYL